MTGDELKQVLHYEPATGVFTRRISKSNGVKIGDVAGSVNKVNGYRLIHVNNKNYNASRLAFLYMTGHFPTNEADHESGVRDDDRWENLRDATRSVNCRNNLIRKDNSSGITGVHWNKSAKKWRARLRINNRPLHLGSFTDKYDAVVARREAEIEHDFYPYPEKSSAHRYIEARNI